MHQVTSDKLCMCQGNPAFWFSLLFPSDRKGDRIVCDRENLAVGDGNFMGIAVEIFDSIAKAVKGFFYVRAPVLFIKVIFKFFPAVRVTQFLTG